jgi:hypothetical protein
VFLLVVACLEHQVQQHAVAEQAVAQVHAQPAARCQEPPGPVAAFLAGLGVAVANRVMSDPLG